jgi:UMF1 family MFS transporter
MRDVPPEAQVQRLGDAFALCGVLFAALALPGLAGLRGLRVAQPPAQPRRAGPGASLRTVAATLRDWRQHRPALQVLAAFFLINDVLVTLAFFVAIVVRDRFGLDVVGVLKLSLMFHLIAIPSTILFGMLADRSGARPTIAAMCALLAIAILLLAFGRAVSAVVLAVVLLGLVVASIQAVFRSLYAGLVPLDKAAELFGFNSIAGRLSAALGPLLFGAALAVLGSSVWAQVLLLIPLAAGVALLYRAPLPSALAGRGPAQAAVRAR